MKIKKPEKIDTTQRMSTLPAINPFKMQTPHSTPVVKTMPGAPQKGEGALYPLPALVAAKLQAQLDGTAKSLDNEFILAMPETNKKQEVQTITLPKLALPGGKFLEPESSEKEPDTNMKIHPLPEEEEEISYSEWYEQQVRDFKLDMRMDDMWR